MSFEENAELVSDIAAEDLVEEVPSPFIEVDGVTIQYAWDATSLEYLKRCPRLYQYKMIEGWQNGKENIDLRFGGEFHKALQDYQILKADDIEHDEAVFLSVKELLLRTDDFRPDDKYKSRDNLVRTVVWYLEKYKDDPAKTMIMATGRPAVEVNFKFEIDCIEGVTYYLCGYLDRVVEYNGETFVMDHKTTTTTPSDYYWKQFDPHNQMTLYTVASQVIFQAMIKGVIINAAQIMVDSNRFTRGISYRTKDGLAEWLGDLQYWLNQALHFAKTNYYPMNDTACDKYGGCRFREICSKAPGIREKYLESEFEKGEIWNPLKPRL